MVLSDLKSQYYDEMYVTSTIPSTEQFGDYVFKKARANGGKIEANGYTFTVVEDTEKGGYKITVSSKKIKETLSVSLSKEGNLGNFVQNETIADSGSTGGDPSSPPTPPTIDPIAGKEDSSKNRTLAGATTGYSYKNPVIPQGFKAVDVGTVVWTYKANAESEVTGWNEGLVIEDVYNGNQFVWVPCKIGAGTSSLVSYSKNFNYDNDYSASKSNTSDDTNACPVNDEKSQIETYGGFYVARYEAGIPSEGLEMSESTNNNANYIPLSKEGSKVWNYIDYTIAVSVSQKMGENNRYGNNVTGLITGTQWDTIISWYEKSGIKTGLTTQNWGTYNNLEYTIKPGYCFNSDESEGTDKISGGTSNWVQNESNILHVALIGRFFHSSGKNDVGIKKNIADMGGNFWEWTTERNSNSYVLRSGAASMGTTRWTSSYRHKRDSGNGDYVISFRTVLYIN